MYYNVECELSRHRTVITVWDRPGLAVEPPCTARVPSSRWYALFNPAAPQQDPITKGLSRHAGRLPFYSGEPPFQEEIIILFTRSLARGRFFAPAPITIPLTRPLYCPPPTPVSSALRPDVRCIQRPHCFLPPSYFFSSLRPFLPLRFTFSAFLWGLSIYELSSTWVFELA